MLAGGWGHVRSYGRRQAGEALTYMVDLAIREQDTKSGRSYKRFVVHPTPMHSDSQIPRTARCRTTARSSHLGNGYPRYAMVLSGLYMRECGCRSDPQPPARRQSGHPRSPACREI